MANLFDTGQKALKISSCHANVHTSWNFVDASFLVFETNINKRSWISEGPVPKFSFGFVQNGICSKDICRRHNAILHFWIHVPYLLAWRHPFTSVERGYDEYCNSYFSFFFIGVVFASMGGVILHKLRSFLKIHSLLSRRCTTQWCMWQFARRTLAKTVFPRVKWKINGLDPCFWG